MSDKQKVIETLNSMSDESSFEDILYNLYVQYEISKGLEDLKNSNTYTADELKEIVKKW